MKPHILYVSYDGAAEPLGRSQVVEYLLRLADEHRITLVSFEKDRAAEAELRAELAAAGIDWRPLDYHHRPPVLSTALDVVRGRRELARIARRDPPDLVHVRSDVAALIAHVARRRTRAPMLFDIRGFWADERVEGGLWRSGGLLHRVARRWEKRFYAETAAVVTLTDASVAQIREWSGGRDMPVEVIPTCADYGAFADTREREGGPHAVWSGSVGTWYRLDLAQRVAAALDMPFTVLTRQVREAQDVLAGREADVRTIPPGAMPTALHAGDVGLYFVLAGPSKRATAPTRIAEYLAAGMPVAVTPGIGDLDALIADNGVGVVLDHEDDASLQASAARLRELAADPDTRERCRRLAAERFDVVSGTRRYAALYARLTGS